MGRYDHDFDDDGDCQCGVASNGPNARKKCPITRAQHDALVCAAVTGQTVLAGVIAMANLTAEISAGKEPAPAKIDSTFVELVTADAIKIADAVMAELSK